MDGTENGTFPDDVTDDELHQEAWERALAHADSYGIYPEEDKPEYYNDEDEGDWHADQYSGNIEGYWEDYDSEKHDGLVAGGGNWVWDE